MFQYCKWWREVLVFRAAETTCCTDYHWDRRIPMLCQV